MNQSIEDQDKITIGQLLGNLKLGQLILLIGILFAIIGVTFGLGIHWERSVYATEIVPLKKLTKELERKSAVLQTDLQFCQAKDKLLSLTSILQFQASIRGNEHDSLYTCSSNQQKLPDHHVVYLYKEYLTIIDEVTKPYNENKAMLSKEDASKACSPRLLELANGQSAAYMINNFMSNN